MQATSLLSVDTVAYDRTHNAVGLYDATHALGRLFAKGHDVIDLIHRMSTNDVLPLQAKYGLAVQTVLTNEKARFIDAITVVRDSVGEVMLVTNRGKEEAVAKWLEKFTIMEDARFLPATAAIHQFAVYGPHGNRLIQEYTNADLISMPQMTVSGITIDGLPATLVKAPRIAESGWWILTASEHASSIFARLEADVLALGGTLVSDELFEVLRIEAGVPKSPNELNEKHNPLETPLASAVSFTKGCYIGQEVIARLDSYDKVQRHLMGAEFEGLTVEVAAELESAIELHSASAAISESTTNVPPLKIKQQTGEDIGELTSYVLSPGPNKVLGLAFIRSAHANPGARIFVEVREGILLPARLVKLPFDV